MEKVIKLTESDLKRIISKILSEQLTAPQNTTTDQPQQSAEDLKKKEMGGVQKDDGSWYFPCLKKIKQIKVPNTQGQYNVMGTIYTFLESGTYKRKSKTGSTKGTWKCDAKGFVELDGKVFGGTSDTPEDTKNTDPVKEPFQWKQAPTAEEVKSGQKLLRYGMMGEFVGQVQDKLRSLGSDPGKTDNKFGGKTLRAVKDFQKKSDLEDDGLVGKKTYAALFKEKQTTTQTENPPQQKEPTKLQPKSRDNFLPDKPKLPLQLTQQQKVIQQPTNQQTTTQQQPTQKTSNIDVQDWG